MRVMRPVSRPPRRTSTGNSVRQWHRAHASGAASAAGPGRIGSPCSSTPHLAQFPRDQAAGRSVPSVRQVSGRAECAVVRRVQRPAQHPYPQEAFRTETVEVRAPSGKVSTLGGPTPGAQADGAVAAIAVCYSTVVGCVQKIGDSRDTNDNAVA